MESAGQAAAAARVDGDHHLPDATPHGEMPCAAEANGGGFVDAAQVATDTLRRKLLKERIREEIFATGRRNLELEVRRELRMGHAVPHQCISPARQADRLQPHMPPSPELRLGETVETPGVVKPRRPVKDRLSGWNRSPWHDRSAGEEDGSSSGWARLPKKKLSGVKRKGIAETSFAWNENSFEKWCCALCHVNLYSEFSFMEHLCWSPAPVNSSIHGTDKSNYWAEEDSNIRALPSPSAQSKRMELQHMPS